MAAAALRGGERARRARAGRRRDLRERRKRVAVIVVVATILGFIALRLVALGVMALARHAPTIARRRLAHGARQYPSARRDDALGRAVARPRPRRARHADADRQQSARRIAPEPAGRNAELLFPRRGQRRDRRLSRIPGGQRAGRQDRRRADDARAVRQDRRDARRRRQGQGKRRLGAGRRPRRHLCAGAARGLGGDRGPMVAAGLFRAAARLDGRRNRRRARPEARRSHHRQCARAQRHGDHRQPAQGELAELCDQFRAGLFAQHVQRARRTRSSSPPPSPRTSARPARSPC